MFARDRASDASERTAGAITETLYHEAAHALIDTLDLAPTGREEDVADQFAAYRLIPQGPAGRAAILAASDNYAQSAGARAPGDVDFADEHPPDATRAANYRCYLYGSAPKENRHLVDGRLLTRQRAAGCADEYDALRRGWDRLLRPYEIDGASHHP
jgi:Putative metallopeptidase